MKSYKCFVIGAAILLTLFSVARAEVLEVPAYATPTVTSSTVLQEGQWYLLEANSTYIWWGTGQTPADAEWFDDPYDDPCDPWLEFSPDPCDDPSTLDLLVNGAGQNWRGTADEVVDNNSIFLPHMYSPSHIYRREFQGTGETINFKIEDGTGANIYDNSGSLWVEISPMTIKLTDPNGGENWVAGNTHDIVWETADDANIANVLIELSTNSGAVWNDVNTVANTGSYDWLVPEVTSPNCLVRISDANDANIYDTSDDVFTIFQCLGPVPGDLDKDCYVDFVDFAIFAEHWLHTGNPLDAQSGIVACWNLDEDSGTIAHDSCNDHDGTLVGDANWVHGVSGSALDFDGNGDYVQVPDSDDLDPSTQEITIAAWVNISTYEAQNSSACFGIVGKTANARPNGSYIFGILNNLSVEPGKLELTVATGGTPPSQDVYSSSLVPKNRWVHVAVTHNIDNITKIYIDGQIDTTDSSTITQVFENNDKNLSIGYSGRYADYFYGSVDEVWIYDRALTATEIQYLYENS